MRSIIAGTAAVSSLLIGFWAISMQAQEAEPGAGASSSTNATWDVGVGVYEGVAGGAAEAVPWFAVAAVVLTACGFLVYAATRGGGR